MLFTLVGASGSDTPTAVVGDSWRHGAPYDPAEVPLARFQAASRPAAVSGFDRARDVGVRAAYGHRRRDDGPWRMRGAPHYLGNQAIRLGIPELQIRHARVQDNRQLAKIAGLLGQLSQEYFASPRRGDGRDFSPVQLRQIHAVLAECEVEIGKVHAIAGAGVEMVEEAYAAFGLAAPIRDYAVIAASDAAGPLAVEVATAGPSEPTTELAAPSLPLGGEDSSPKSKSRPTAKV